MSIKYKEIRVYPSDFIMDVVEAPKEDSKEMIEFLKERYSINTDEFFDSHQTWDFCATIEPGTKNKVKNQIRVLLCVDNLDRADIVVHELVHALYRISDFLQLEVHYDSQEWQAVLMEFLFKEIYTVKGWKEWKSKKIEK